MSAHLGAIHGRKCGSDEEIEAIVVQTEPQFKEPAPFLFPNDILQWHGDYVRDKQETVRCK